MEGTWAEFLRGHFLEVQPQSAGMWPLEGQGVKMQGEADLASDRVEPGTENLDGTSQMVRNSDSSPEEEHPCHHCVSVFSPVVG